MSDDDQKLINYFEGRDLPKPPFRLSASEIINDLSGFIAIQVNHLENGMSAGSGRTKLRQLKARLEEQQNNQRLKRRLYLTKHIEFGQVLCNRSKLHCQARKQ